MHIDIHMIADQVEELFLLSFWILIVILILIGPKFECVSFEQAKARVRGGLVRA